MRRVFFGFLVFFCALGICAAAGIVDEAAKGNEKADLSYAFGMLIGADLIETGFEFNYDAFMRGFRAIMENETTTFSIDEAMRIINSAFIAAYAEESERNQLLGEAFLAENGARPDVIVTPSGLQYEVVLEGTGDIPGPSDIVLVHYLGRTLDGVVFDTTYARGSPAEIPLDRVIQGWAEGLRMMREGGRAILYVPPNLAYGENGAGTLIGPNAVIVFDVELLAILQSFLSEEEDEGEWRPLLED